MNFSLRKCIDAVRNYYRYEFKTNGDLERDNLRDELRVLFARVVYNLTYLELFEYARGAYGESLADHYVMDYHQLQVLNQFKAFQGRGLLCHGRLDKVRPDDRDLRTMLSAYCYLPVRDSWAALKVSTPEPLNFVFDRRSLDDVHDGVVKVFCVMCEYLMSRPKDYRFTQVEMFPSALHHF